MAQYLTNFNNFKRSIEYQDWMHIAILLGMRSVLILDTHISILVTILICRNYLLRYILASLFYIKGFHFGKST